MKVFRILRKILLWLSFPIRKNPFFFGFMYLLVVLSFFYEKLPTDEPAFFQGLFIDCYLLSALLLVLPHRIRPWAKGSLYFFTYLITFIEWFLYARFWLRYTPTTLQLALETNPDEAGEFIQAYLLNPKMWDVTWKLGIVALLNIACEIWGARLFVALRKLIPSYPRTVLAMLFGAVCIGYTGFCCYATREDKAHFIEYFRLKGAERIERVMGPGRFYSPFSRLMYSLKFTQLTAGEVEVLRTHMHEIKVDSCQVITPNLVFIIGESYNKHHSQLYGYQRPTTPLMLERQKKGQVICFTDVVTPWNVTSNAFKSILSTHAEDQPGIWADGVLFPAIFKKAGYTVSFFTQQFLKSTRQAAVDFNGSFFLNDEELDTLNFDIRNKKKWTQDMGLVKEYRAHTDEYGQQNLFIFHLIGQHVNYRDRYPNAERYFTGDSIDRPDLSASEKDIVAEYDNATRYNDKVVDAICNAFADQDALVIYMADHGEEVFDDIKAFGRLHDANLSPELVKAEFEVPLLIWGSQQFRRKHKALFTALKNAANGSYKTDDIAHFLLGLGGILTPLYDKSRDWLNEDYESHPRILKHTADYDRIMKKQ